MPRSNFHHHGDDRFDAEPVCSGLRFYHGTDFDLESADDAPARDEALRELVDALPEAERHMIERTHFAGETLTAASAELGFSRSTGARVLRDGYERLKGWLENGVTKPIVGVVAPEVTIVDDLHVPLACSFEHPEWGRCQRPEHTHGLCANHLFWLRTGITPNEDYHRKVVEGQRGVQEFLSEAEMEALVNGRYRGDGRRLDQYITHDPLGFMPWPGSEEA